MMKILAVLLSLVIFVPFISCKKEKKEETPEKVLTDYIVKNNEITGWTYSGSGWTANNISELTNYINGAAEIYQRHGFVEAAYQVYQGMINNASCQLTLTLYDQGSSSGAQALYNDPDLGFSGAINWNNGAGEAAHYVRYGLSQELGFYRNAIYVHLDVNNDTEESLNVLKQFALNVDGKIK